MAAYGALVSVMQIMDQLHRHPHPPISLDQKQSESLAANVTFLQIFLEGYNPHRTYISEADPLESRIAEAAYAAEDVIESYIIDQINLARSTDHVEEISSIEFSQEVEDAIKSYFADQINLAQSTDHDEEISTIEFSQDIGNAKEVKPTTNEGEKSSCIEFFQCVPTLMSYVAHTIQQLLEGYHPRVSYSLAEDVIESDIVNHIHSRPSDHAQEISSIEFSQGLEKVIEEMDMIKMKIQEMKEKKEMGVQIIKKKSTSDDGGSSRSSSTAQKVTTMIGFDDLLSEMLDKLTGGEEKREIIPIVGMGGLGKTTLARNVYEHPLIKERFHVCAWSTISQVHNAKNILSEILDQVDKPDKERDLSENELGYKLYQYLLGRRYLIVMDDIWSIEAWDNVRLYIPNNSHGSKIVITTRLSNLASQFNPFNNSLVMKFLDKASSWDLFSKTVFGEEICPLELEEIGKKIVEGCRGLPLSIVVAGGLLSKSEPTRENWELIGENLSSVVNSEDDGNCLQILYTSYNNLPIYIKPCFLYLGLSEEDTEIAVDMQIPRWVAEGFIRPRDGKILEEVAKEYIEELIDRHLILVEKCDDCGDVETFKVHDLVRDLAMREAAKDRFLYSLMQSSDGRKISQGMISTHRRIFASSLDEEYPFIEYEEDTAELSLVRTLVGKIPKECLSLPSFRLMRVCVMGKETDDEFYEDIFVRLLNLRILAVSSYNDLLLKIPSYLWNLQTLYIYDHHDMFDCASVIWKMPQLRVVAMADTTLRLPDPPLNGEEVILENLHTLFEMRNLKFSEEVLKRIPNLRVLKLSYCYDEEEEDADYCLNNLHRLNKLQNLHLLGLELYFPSMQELTLPFSLKQLTLNNTRLPWEEMALKIGCLPLLQVLRLIDNACIGSQWETVEGQFCALKFLEIENCRALECWTTDDNTHFPRLQHLQLTSLKRLGEIPSSIGDILTLRSIRVVYCSVSVEESARRIVEEQKELGNEDIELQVKSQKNL